MAVKLQRVDLSFRTKLLRYTWSMVWFVLCRTTPRFMHAWRCWVLHLFGAVVEKPVYVYPTARIWAPWNLTLRRQSTIAENVDVYCVDRIEIGEGSTVSQYSFLCTASHDYGDPVILERPEMPLVSAPITLGERVWVAADVFVAPGVEVCEGAVIQARSSVFSDVGPWTVVAGNPARAVRKRVLRTND